MPRQELSFYEEKVTGLTYLLDKEYKDTLLDSWRFCQKEKGTEIYGRCNLSSHANSKKVTY